MPSKGLYPPHPYSIAIYAMVRKSLYLLKYAENLALRGYDFGFTRITHPMTSWGCPPDPCFRDLATSIFRPLYSDPFSGSAPHKFISVHNDQFVYIEFNEAEILKLITD